PVEAQRLAPGDRRGGEVAELPVLRAVDRAADDGHALLDRDHCGAGLHRPGDARALPSALDEEAEHVALSHDLAHPPHRVAIRLAAPDGDRAEDADELAEPRDLVRLGLRHEIRA